MGSRFTHYQYLLLVSSDRSLREPTEFAAESLVDGGRRTVDFALNAYYRGLQRMGPPAGMTVFISFSRCHI